MFVDVTWNVEDAGNGDALCVSLSLSPRHAITEYKRSLPQASAKMNRQEAATRLVRGVEAPMCPPHFQTYHALPYLESQDKFKDTKETVRMTFI